MAKQLQLSVRELCLGSVIAALSIALFIASSTESAPMYLHVFGSMVDSTHDDLRPSDAPKSPDGLPWTRIATVEIYDGRPFGFFTPNDRSPSIGIDGRLDRGLDNKYHGAIHFRLDDNNLTYDLTETVALTPDTVVTIDPNYDVYVLSSEEDPYAALSDAIQ